jgi:hypothetical protein
MVVVNESPHEAVVVDLRQACVDLAEARAVARRVHTPESAARIDRCRARIDELLDLWNEVAADG